MKFGKNYYHNEIELIKVNSKDLKAKIEKDFLRNGISYYIRWGRPGFFERRSSKKEMEDCIFCINDWDKEKALELLQKYESVLASNGELLLKKTASFLSDMYIYKNREFM